MLSAGSARAQESFYLDEAWGGAAVRVSEEAGVIALTCGEGLSAQRVEMDAGGAQAWALALTTPGAELLSLGRAQGLGDAWPNALIARQAAPEGERFRLRVAMTSFDRPCGATLSGADLQALSNALARAAEEGTARRVALGAPLDYVEEDPVLIGGLDALAARIQYPEQAQVMGIEGTVYVQFVVDETGAVTVPEVVHSPHPLLSSAALNAVLGSSFLPGRLGGRAVKVRFTLPVRFALVDERPAEP